MCSSDSFQKADSFKIKKNSVCLVYMIFFSLKNFKRILQIKNASSQKAFKRYLRATDISSCLGR